MPASYPHLPPLANWSHLSCPIKIRNSSDLCVWQFLAYLHKSHLCFSVRESWKYLHWMQCQFCLNPQTRWLRVLLAFVLFCCPWTSSPVSKLTSVGIATSWQHNKFMSYFKLAAHPPLWKLLKLTFHESSLEKGNARPHFILMWPSVYAT